MSARLVAGIVALACIPTYGIIATSTYYEIVDMVNEKLPAECQFAWEGWYFTKQRRLHRGYRRLYPSGRLLRRIRCLDALMIACLLICAWCFGFFRS